MNIIKEEQSVGAEYKVIDEFTGNMKVFYSPIVLEEEQEQAFVEECLAREVAAADYYGTEDIVTEIAQEELAPDILDIDTLKLEVTTVIDKYVEILTPMEIDNTIVEVREEQLVPPLESDVV